MSHTENMIYDGLETKMRQIYKTLNFIDYKIGKNGFVDLISVLLLSGHT